MRTKYIVIFVFLFTAAVNSGKAQSMYQLTFEVIKKPCTALFILQQNGTGTLRIKIPYSQNDEKTILEIQAEEQYPDPATETSTDKVFYKLTRPVLISGPNQEKYEPGFLVFKRTSNDDYEPFGMADEIKGTGNGVTQFSAVLFLDRKKLEKELVLEYFTRQDPVYKGLFETQARALSPFEKNIKLTLLAVANTNEPVIGGSCLKDMNRAVETFSKLAEFMGIQFESKTISGNDYNKASVEKQLAALLPKQNDIIVFYYSGHGFRKPKDSRRFPYIDLRAKPDNSYMTNSLNIEDIYEQVRKKGARLNLVIGDCCNSEVSAKNAIGSPIPRKKGFSMTWNMENCRALFLNPIPRSIIVTAADRDQKASSNNEFGGFFSYFFKTSMEDQLSFFKKNASWENVLNETKKSTILKAEHTYCDKPYVAENICEQYPIWK